MGSIGMSFVPPVALVCQGCKKTPEQLEEVQIYLDEDGTFDGFATESEFIWNMEGTLNRDNGHFLCNDCYIQAGMPSSPFGWVCP